MGTFIDGHRAVRTVVQFVGRCCLILLLVSTAAACTDNAPYRTVEAVQCERASCNPAAYIEVNPTYDLAFVEFSERGNVFSRERMNQVLKFVGDRAREDRGVLTIVFVHGWKHNASGTDENVASFNKLLGKIAALVNATKLPQVRRVVGVYVGWRGLSVDWGDPLTNVSYWERKATAEQVAKGGVTELLLRLEKAVVGERDAGPVNRNLFLVTGHSFGGAVVLAALNEIMLDRIVSGIPVEGEDGCVVTDSFGHGVVLLNPAIEANEALQLKELVAENCFGPRQVRLMHVISSDADEATNKFFRIGQFLGVNLTWKQTELLRTFDNQPTLTLEESELDTITVGNFKPFQTGQLDRDPNADGKWLYRSCVGKTVDCLDEPDGQVHINVEHNEPLAFIQTDGNFILNHNDIFNDYVAAYLAAVVAEARYKLTLQRELNDPGLVAQCIAENGKDFDFGACFAFYQSQFEALPKEDRSASPSGTSVSL